ncbi:MAG TPA: LemA family protein [Myxococcales bacterium]|nr:LemA family protein [Myxococcales bacterium]
MRRFALGTVGIPLLFSAGCGVQSIPQTKNAVDAAWAEVENQYQRRADLVPNLVATVKGYATHEQSTLEAVTAARAKATSVTVDASKLTPQAMQQFEQAQGALGGALSRLLAVAESYPDLKANQNFRDLQVQLEGTENRISIARRRYIEQVQEFNNLVTVVPTSWTNSLMYHYTPKPQFTATTEGAAKAPQVKF